MAVILDFLSERFSLVLIYKSPQCFLPSFKSIGFPVLEKKRKIDFQDGGHGNHLGFPIGTILAIFDLQVTPALPTKFGVNCLLIEEKKRKIDFQDGGRYLGFPIGTIKILAVFDLQVTRCFLPSIESIGPVV